MANDISASAVSKSAAGKRASRERARPPFECIALVLQGGGALGAYQAGVYAALAEAGLHPDWTAGISIGAINAAIIAGNAPTERVGKLRQFWELVTAPYPQSLRVTRTADAPPATKTADAKGSAKTAAALGANAGNGSGHLDFARLLAPWGEFGDFTSMLKGDFTRGLLNQWSAGRALFAGAPGFFAPRPFTPWLSPEGSIDATSYYDTRPLKATLERLIDFDRINRDDMRLSVGTVNVRTGNFVYFDNTTHRIGPEHVMASGALPPGFPAVEIDGEHYWDGGLVSNTPLRWIVERRPQRDTLVFQVDLWSSRGQFPGNMARVATRQKEIQYSSRTRAASDRFKEMQCVRNAIAQLLEKLPSELSETPEAQLLRRYSERKVWNLIQLIYRSKEYEGDSKDYEFSRQSMEDHWRAGYHDTVRTLRHPEVLERPQNREGVFIFDIAEDGRE
jgi:NTE family protein